MAKFWASRAEYNSATDQYEIKGNQKKIVKLYITYRNIT